MHRPPGIPVHVIGEHAWLCRRSIGNRPVGDNSASHQAAAIHVVGGRVGGIEIGPQRQKLRIAVHQSGNRVSPAQPFQRRLSTAVCICRCAGRAKPDVDHQRRQPHQGEENRHEQHQRVARAIRLSAAPSSHDSPPYDMVRNHFPLRPPPGTSAGVQRRAAEDSRTGLGQSVVLRRHDGTIARSVEGTNCRCVPIITSM